MSQYDGYTFDIPPMTLADLEILLSTDPNTNPDAPQSANFQISSVLEQMNSAAWKETGPPVEFSNPYAVSCDAHGKLSWKPKTLTKDQKSFLVGMSAGADYAKDTAPPPYSSPDRPMGEGRLGAVRITSSRLNVCPEYEEIETGYGMRHRVIVSERVEIQLDIAIKQKPELNLWSHALSDSIEKTIEDHFWPRADRPRPAADVTLPVPPWARTGPARPQKKDFGDDTKRYAQAMAAYVEEMEGIVAGLNQMRCELANKTAALEEAKSMLNKTYYAMQQAKQAAQGEANTLASLRSQLNLSAGERSTLMTQRNQLQAQVQKLQAEVVSGDLSQKPEESLIAAALKVAEEIARRRTDSQGIALLARVRALTHKGGAQPLLRKIAQDPPLGDHHALPASA